MKKDSTHKRLQAAYRKKLEAQMQDNKTLEDLKFECKIESSKLNVKAGKQQSLNELIEIIRKD